MSVQLVASSLEMVCLEDSKILLLSHSSRSGNANISLFSLFIVLGIGISDQNSAVADKWLVGKLHLNCEIKCPAVYISRYLLIIYIIVTTQNILVVLFKNILMSHLLA